MGGEDRVAGDRVDGRGWKDPIVTPLCDGETDDIAAFVLKVLPTLEKLDHYIEKTIAEERLKHVDLTAPVRLSPRGVA
ncbi:hypothetical protein [Arthrobacter sp. ISL-30]|uniref:hypothetical protein n=1 Tax=Arthrobacter sp. ISL-30 TaxID=2819109 RepID=UPI001BE79ABD|nr:hypothetical protein [Arthrobacter sp. ISL-30]MBT2514114.1 hypothetical protein [Arthrobacter sp. ISL-30]